MTALAPWLRRLTSTLQFRIAAAVVMAVALSLWVLSQIAQETAELRTADQARAVEQAQFQDRAAHIKSALTRQKSDDPKKLLATLGALGYSDALVMVATRDSWEQGDDMGLRKALSSGRAATSRRDDEVGELSGCLFNLWTNDGPDSPSDCQYPSDLDTGRIAERITLDGTRELVHVVTYRKPSNGSQADLPQVGPALERATWPTLAVASALAWAFAWWLRRPLVQGAKVAKSIGDGDLTQRVPVRGSDEVARYAEAVNAMADSLTAQIERLTEAEAHQRRFVADVAHELRTPAASLLAAATALEDPATREAAANRLAPELRRLAVLTEDLLELSRFDGGHITLDHRPTDLTDLVTRVAEAAGGATVHTMGDTELDVDPRRVALVVRNLVRNAHTHGAAPVNVAVIGDDSAVRVLVSDSGPGVPEELRQRIFDRFVQADQSRHGVGSGLGLAIARENARLHGGELALEKDGRTFRLVLPRRSTASGPGETDT